MTYYEVQMTRKEALAEAIKMMKLNGYTVYAVKHSDGNLTTERGLYVYAITPTSNILYIQPNRFEGWDITLVYVPSPKHGSGCRDARSQPYQNLSLSALREAEKLNLAMAHKLKAKLYKSPEDWKKSYWFELVEL